MNVYDFDKTIYRNDSTADFFMYCLRKHPKIIVTTPKMFFAFVNFYILKKGTKTEFKEKLYKFLKYIDVETEVEIFWDKNICKVKDFYKQTQKDDDVIISASPEFIIKPICKRLNIKYAMASRVDKYTGRYDGINCYGEEKVRRFYEVFPDKRIDEFYSDSYSDTPLAKLAKRAYLVKGDKLFEWDKF